MHTSALRLLRYPTGGSAYGRRTASAACEEVIGRYALAHIVGETGLAQAEVLGIAARVGVR
eukprot:3240036-Prymnesium_polylepis.1